MKKKIPAKSNCRLALAKLECKLKQQQRQWVNGKKVKKNWIHSVDARDFFLLLPCSIYTQQRAKSFSSIVVFHAIFFFNIFCSNLLSLLYFPHNFFFRCCYVLLCIFFCWLLRLLPLHFFLCVFWCFLFNLTWLARVLLLLLLLFNKHESNETWRKRARIAGEITNISSNSMTCTMIVLIIISFLWSN